MKFPLYPQSFAVGPRISTSLTRLPTDPLLSSTSQFNASVCFLLLLVVMKVSCLPQLYYDTHVNATTAVLATFSTAVFGYSVVGLLRPLTVYPAEMVYWANLPTVSVFQCTNDAPLPVYCMS